MISFGYSNRPGESKRLAVLSQSEEAGTLSYHCLRAAIFVGLLLAAAYSFLALRSLTTVVDTLVTQTQPNWPVSLPASEDRSEGSNQVALISSGLSDSSLIIEELIRRVESLENSETELERFKDNVNAQLYRTQAVRFLKVAFKELANLPQKLQLLYLRPRRRASVSGFGLGALGKLYTRLKGKDPAGLLGETHQSAPLCASKGTVRVIYRARVGLRANLIRFSLPAVA